MYRPSTFDVTDTTVLLDAIRANSFGVVVAYAGDDLEASHLPLVLDDERGALLGHVARANRLWQLADGQRVLAIFSGPHAYISPTWYGVPNMVPTWNYVAVHVTGTFHAIHDADIKRQIVERSAAAYEASQPSPWTNELGDDLTGKMLTAIVGFSIEIDKIEGKWKLSQNRSEAAIQKAADHLAGAQDDNSRQIAELMRNPPLGLAVI